MMTSFCAEDLCRHLDAMRVLARDLLGDDELAADAVQQACVKALQRPPAAVVAAKAWLLAVVRSCALDRQRAERRRLRRELVAADSIDADSIGTASSDSVSQLELQEHLAAAVRSLDEIYRTVVWLRYFEGLSPTRIAVKLDEPVKTIKTRLWRALQLLRERLEGRYGDRRALFGALLPLASMPVTKPTLGAALAAGTWMMQAKNMLYVAAVLLFVVGGAALSWREAAPVPEPAAVVPLASGDCAALDHLAPPSELARRAAVVADTTKATSDEPYGGLVVQVRWDDGTPAADVAVTFASRSEPQLDRAALRVVADAAGVARAERLHEGLVSLTSDRGGKLQAEVVAGDSREVVFTLPRGVDVAGKVVDPRRVPVSGAQVVIVSPARGWLGGRAVAVSDASGNFAIRSLDPTWSLGALAAGYAPSPLFDLEDLDGKASEVVAEQASVQVELQLLESGASVAGLVVDGNGAAVAGALVVLGYGGGGHLEAGRIRESWSPQVAYSDDAGNFRFDAVAPGHQDIAARADGYARSFDVLQCVAGETRSITLKMELGVTVQGVVRDQSGAVVEGAVVMALDAPAVDVSIDLALRHDRQELQRPETLSDANGRFRLRWAPPGNVHLVAATRQNPSQFAGVTQHCQQTFVAGAGEEIRWDPVLVGGRTLRVRVVEADGKQAWLGGALYAIAEQPSGVAASLSAFQKSWEGDDSNLFEFSDCADVSYTVFASVTRMGQETRYVYLRGVRPDGKEVALRMPNVPQPGETGTVVGRVVDQGNRFDGRAIKVSLNTSAMRKHLDVEDGRFVAKDVPPGRYFIWATVGGDPVIHSPWFEVLSAQHLDLGDLATKERASIRVTLRTPPGVTLEAANGDINTSWDRCGLRWNGRELIADNVSIGRHRLLLSTKNWHAPPRDVELVAGRDNSFVVDVVPATMRKFAFLFPLPDKWQSCEITLLDEQGNLVSEHRKLSSEAVGLTGWLWHHDQPFGVFRLQVVMDGVKHSWPVDLREPASDDEVTQFSLR